MEINYFLCKHFISKYFLVLFRWIGSEGRQSFVKLLSILHPTSYMTFESDFKYFTIIPLFDVEKSHNEEDNTTTECRNQICYIWNQICYWRTKMELDLLLKKQIEIVPAKNKQDKLGTSITYLCSPLSSQLASSQLVHVCLDPRGVTCRRDSKAQVN